MRSNILPLTFSHVALTTSIHAYTVNNAIINSVDQ